MLKNKLLLAFVMTIVLIIGRNSQELTAAAFPTTNASIFKADDGIYQTQPPCNPKKDKNCQ